jgi:putative tricarboxylic transport membrane protein
MANMIENLAQGFSVALSLSNLFYCFTGVLVGTAIGVLPGVGSMAAISMLLPVTFHLDPTSAIIMLAGVYYGAEYGGSTASILLNLPGTPSNAVACIDGYPMSKQGRAGVALFTTTIASFVGGTLGIVVLIVATPAFVAFALRFGAAEYFVALVLGLLLAASVSQGRPVKGIAMLAVGLLLGSIGADVQTGTARFTLGYFHLYDGISIIVIAMGLFGVSEIIMSVRDRPFKIEQKITLRSLLPTRQDARRSVAPMLRGTGVGTIIGPLPGAGLALAAFLSYAIEKRVADDPSRFGRGAIEGVAAPEAANNAAAQTAFIPTFALGIPGTATMAIMLGALMLHGIAPGPQLIRENMELFWGVVASFWIGNIFLLIINIPFIGVWVSLLKVPYRFLYPCIVCLICIGVYSINNSLFDLALVLLFGVAGYLMRMLEFEPAPLLMGFVLGPLMEENFRRAMLLTGGDFLALFQRPISATMLALAAGAVAWVAWRSYRRRSALRLKSDPTR